MSDTSNADKLADYHHDPAYERRVVVFYDILGWRNQHDRFDTCDLEVRPEVCVLDHKGTILVGEGEQPILSWPRARALVAIGLEHRCVLSDQLELSERRTGPRKPDRLAEDRDFVITEL